MKFKATLHSTYLLSQVIQTLEKLGQSCVLHLTPDVVHFSLTHHFTAGEQAFVELTVASLFEEYQIESKANNEIPMIINLSNLLRAVKSGERAQRMIMKLKKKNNRAYLCIEIIESVNITQDIPISLQPLKKILEEYQEPLLPEPQIQVKMPPLGGLKTVIERMRSISEELLIEASSDGQVCFRVDTDQVNIRTFYKGLAIKPEEKEEELIQAKATLKIKKFARILNCRQLPAEYTLGCIVENHAFVVYCKLKESAGGATFYIPLLAQ